MGLGVWLGLGGGLGVGLGGGVRGGLGVGLENKERTKGDQRHY